MRSLACSRPTLAIGTILALWSTSTLAETLEVISEKAKPTTVYLSITYFDKLINDVKTTEGSGVIISAQGYILTDYHVIQGWLDSSAEEQQKHPLKAHIGGSKFKPEYPIAYDTREKNADIALLHILDPNKYQFAPICYDAGIGAGSPLVAFGYPNDTDFAVVPGNFNNLNGENNRWLATIAFSHGMSGGPVYNDKGYVIGLVYGGTDTATNLITPLRWAKSIIENRTTVASACVTPNDSRAAQATLREALLGWWKAPPPLPYLTDRWLKFEQANTDSGLRVIERGIKFNDDGSAQYQVDETNHLVATFEGNEVVLIKIEGKDATITEGHMDYPPYTPDSYSLTFDGKSLYGITWDNKSSHALQFSRTTPPLITHWSSAPAPSSSYGRPIPPPHR